MTSFPSNNHNPPWGCTYVCLNREKVVCQKGGWEACCFFFKIPSLCVYVHNAHIHNECIYVKTMAWNKCSLPWSQVLTMPSSMCRTLDKPLNFSVPWIHICKMRTITVTSRILVKFKWMNSFKCFEQWVPHCLKKKKEMVSKCYVSYYSTTTSLFLTCLLSRMDFYLCSCLRSGPSSSRPALPFAPGCLTLLLPPFLLLLSRFSRVWLCATP